MAGSKVLRRVGRLAVLIFLLLIGQTSFAQQIRWRNAPAKGFVFQITNNEAQKLLTRFTSDSIVSKMLHTQVDTFDVYKGWINRPSKGHFILASIVGNALHCEYTSVFPYQVFLLKEYNALALQVLDLEGNVRDDAKVRLAFRKIRIDRESKTYRLENSWFLGDDKVVTVELDGFRSVFNIEKHEAPTWENDYRSDSDGPAFYSYMITDKNKYKPNEKIRFKSFALSHSRSPLHKELDAVLYRYEAKPIIVARVSPHRPGSYAGEFQLNDSLKLKLDRSYELQLRDKNGRIVSRCSFTYEDYELDGNKLEIHLREDHQYHPGSNELSILATDENGLILKDARATVLVKTNAIREVFEPVVTLKDTLLYKELILNTQGATTLPIPADIFKKSNTSYDVFVTVLNSENKRIERGLPGEYYYSNYELRASLVADSILYEVYSNGRLMSKVPAKIRRNNEVNFRETELPLREKINPAASVVEIVTDNLSRTISLRDLAPKIEMRGGIVKDSLKIYLHNPHKLETTWYIYKGSQLVHKGFGTEMSFDSLITDRSDTYYAEVLYTFGGEDQIKRKAYEFRSSHLGIDFKIPDRAFPGQTVEALIEVTNDAGESVCNVDLTALAVTSKLNYRLADLPYYGDVSAARPQATTFSKNPVDKRSANLKLDYTKWEKKARLDTMMYYKFTYPKGLFTYTINAPNATQFAPYVMKDGLTEQTFVIEVDRTPVYFSWTDQPDQYSFLVDPRNYHEVSLRLYDRVLILDSIRFESGKKTILSFDLDHLPASVRTVKVNLPSKRYRKPPMYHSFTPTEVTRYQQYISAFKYLKGNSYLESPDEFTPLFNARSNATYGSYIKVGPIHGSTKTYTNEWTGNKITYTQTNGYKYSFEDRNVVYREDVKDLVLARLYSRSYDPMSNINDKVMTREEFVKEPVVDKRWHPNVLDLIDASIRLKVLLPFEKAASGFNAFLFQNTVTKEIISPCQYRIYSYNSQYFNIPRGQFNAIAIFNNGTYLKIDGVDLRSNTQVVVDLSRTSLHEADADSQLWLKTGDEKCYYSNDVKSYELRPRKFMPASIRGVVYADDNSVLPGANVVIKGTSYGTVTDVNGEFEIGVDQSFVTLVFSFIGLITQEVEVQLGSDVSIQMVADIAQLSEVVVTGYGSVSLKDITGSVSSVLQGQVAGVSISDAEPSISLPVDDIIAERGEAEATLYRELLNLKTIRSNFSDVGFWEPKLFTDKKGQAKFSVTYPDDITQWNATVYAMTRHLQTGTTRKSIRSYKPIMAQLAVPNFLTVGDSAVFSGKVLNYSDSKTITGKVKWSGAGGNTENEVRFNDFQLDKHPVVVSDVDSVKLVYSFTRDDGYLDGEERKVPVVEQGIVRADGELIILTNKNKRTIEAKKNENVTVEILASQLDIYAGEARYLLNYKYDCNEQLASKLLGLISYKRLMEYEGKTFRYDKDINKIITRLLKNQNQEFLWSWWNVSENSSYWMSAHILRALKTAADAGYHVGLDIENVRRKAEYNFDNRKNLSLWSVDLLNVLAEWNVNLKYSKYIQHLDSTIRGAEESQREFYKRHGYRYSYLREKLLLQETRQLMNLAFDPGVVLSYKNDGVLGEIFFSDAMQERHWYSNDLTINTIAYRILRRDSTLKPMTTGMQLYFLNKRNQRAWNTYHSSSITAEILPDLLADGANKKQPAAITLDGKVSTTVNKFPYKIELQSGEQLTVSKDSGVPAYLMHYKHERVTKARKGVEGFEITTNLKNGGYMEAGKPATLSVNVNVTKESDLEYVMIEIPIPGSCSYADKSRGRNEIETHREYFKDRTVIFCENMRSGSYTFEVRLLPRFTGKYFVNPAQVSLMYVPVVNANTDMKTVTVK